MGHWASPASLRFKVTLTVCSLSIPLDATALYGGIEKLQFNVSTSSVSEELDNNNNNLDFRLQLKTEADLEMIGNSQPKELNLMEDGKVKETTLKQTFQVSFISNQ